MPIPDWLHWTLSTVLVISIIGIPVGAVVFDYWDRRRIRKRKQQEIKTNGLHHWDTTDEHREHLNTQLRRPRHGADRSSDGPSSGGEDLRD